MLWDFLFYGIIWVQIFYILCALLVLTVESNVVLFKSSYFTHFCIMEPFSWSFSLWKWKRWFSSTDLVVLLCFTQLMKVSWQLKVAFPGWARKKFIKKLRNRDWGLKRILFLIRTFKPLSYHKFWNLTNKNQQSSMPITFFEIFPKNLKSSAKPKEPKSTWKSFSSSQLSLGIIYVEIF